MGGGIPSLSGGFFFSHLNAPDLNQIGKTGGQFGGSIGAGVSMGIDVITAENKPGDDFGGISVNIGLGISSTVGEAHGLVTYTVEDRRLWGE